MKYFVFVTYLACCNLHIRYYENVNLHFYCLIKNVCEQCLLCKKKTSKVKKNTSKDLKSHLSFCVPLPKIEHILLVVKFNRS